MAESRSAAGPRGPAADPKPEQYGCKKCNCSEFKEAAGSSFCQRQTCKHGIWEHDI